MLIGFIKRTSIFVQHCLLKWLFEKCLASFEISGLDVITSPIFVGLAPISCCRLRMSFVGPAMRDVPVSTMAWQPWGQNELIPWTATLKHILRYHWAEILNIGCESMFRMKLLELLGEPVHFNLPVSFRSHRDPVDWASVKCLICSPQQQFTLWVGIACFPAGMKNTLQSTKLHLISVFDLEKKSKWIQTGNGAFLSRYHLLPQGPSDY